MRTPVSSGSTGTQKPYGFKPKPYGWYFADSNDERTQHDDSAKPYGPPHRVVQRPPESASECPRAVYAARSLPHARAGPQNRASGTHAGVDRGDGIATDGGERVAKAPIRDEDLLETLEAAEEEHGSLAEAIRAMVRNYDDDAATAGIDADLPEDARTAYEVLREHCANGNTVELSVAESLLAQHLGVDSAAVRSMALRPLRKADLVTLNTGLHTVSLTIHEPEQPADTTAEEVPADD